MRRRRLLATLATGAVGATAGCGYAYGGGDLREEASIYAGGFGTVRWVLAADRIVAANSGRHFDHEREGLHEGTSVTVADLDGNELWRHTHWERSPHVAGVDPVYLLDEQGQVVALAGPELDDELSTAERGPVDGDELWRVAVEGAGPPLVRDDRGANVAVGTELVAVRDGDVAWRADLPAPAVGVRVAGDTILVTTDAAVVGLTAAGQERWRRETDGGAALAVTGDRAAIHDGDAVAVVDTESGEPEWTANLGSLPTRLHATGGRIFLSHRGVLRVFDAETGERAWKHDFGTGLEHPFVQAPEGTYAVSDGCRVLALNGEGIRWSRQVSPSRGCEVVGGWLDGEQVAFLFESGDLRWLQRTDQNPGLL